MSINPSEAPESTQAAAQHAADAGIDLANVTGTGVGGRIKKSDVEAVARDMEAGEAGEPVNGSGHYYYCMNENHPGAPSFQSSPLSLVRIYQSDKEVPECPACGGQTNSVPCDGPDIPPESILQLQERFGR